MPIININRGSTVEFDGEKMKVVAPKGFDEVILRRKNGDYVTVSVPDLFAEPSVTNPKRRVVDALREEKVPVYWEALGDLAVGRSRGVQAVKTAGDKLGISPAAVYRALQRYKLSGLASDLPPPTRNGGRGKSRLNPKVEAVIEQKIEETLLTRRQIPPSEFYREVRAALSKRGLYASQSTLRSRVNAIEPHRAMRKRAGYNEAKRALDPHKGNHPEVLRPLQLIQMDHWQMDIEILGDDRLQTAGRPWLTLAIDVYSRMIYGFHIGMDSPCTTTAGLAMICGMTRKDSLIERYGLAMEWPICGKGEVLALDNAGEFRGRSLKLSAKHFGMELSWRPVEAPQYGAYIEALNGTLAERFKGLPGATGSNPKERKAFRPSATATFTLDDLYKHMLLMFDEYHTHTHLGIGTSPLERFKSYYFGPNGQKRRVPSYYPDDDELRINWYPLVFRSIQRYGIRIDHLDYYNEELEQLVRNRKAVDRIAVRRNPFDVREIFILHPTTKQWRAVPTRHIGFPIASLFELQAAIRRALKDKRGATPKALAAIIDAQREHIEETRKKTRSAQRLSTRIAHHDRMRASTRPGPPPTPPPSSAPSIPSASEQEWSSTRPTLPHGPADESLRDILSRVSDADIEADFDDD